MDADLAYFLAAACILAGVYGFWHSSLGARETANRIAREACSRAVVQLLDGTVAFAGLRLGRDARGAAHVAADLYVRLHQRRLRALARLHRDGRPESQVGRARRRPLISDETGIDLHTHSHCSDGSLAPRELVERAAAAGVRVLALTDHDTLAGLAEALRQPSGWVFASYRGSRSPRPGATSRSTCSGSGSIPPHPRSALRSMRRPSAGASGCAACAPHWASSDCRAMSCSRRSRPIPAVQPRALAAALLQQGHVPRIQEFRKYLGRADLDTSPPNGPRSKRSSAGCARRAARRASHIRPATCCPRVGASASRPISRRRAAPRSRWYPAATARRMPRPARRSRSHSGCAARSARTFTARNSLGILWGGWLSYRPASTRYGATVTENR